MKASSRCKNCARLVASPGRHSEHARCHRLGSGDTGEQKPKKQHSSPSMITTQVGFTPPLLVGLLPLLQPRPTLSHLLLAEHSLPLLPTASSLLLSSFSVGAIIAEVRVHLFRSTDHYIPRSPPRQPWCHGPPCWLPPQLYSPFPTQFSQCFTRCSSFVLFILSDNYCQYPRRI